MTFMELLERFIFKITSGRFIFTIAAALVFSYMAVTGKINEERAMSVILVVLYAYFTRNRTDLNDNGNGQLKTITTTTLPPAK